MKTNIYLLQFEVEMSFLTGKAIKKALETENDLTLEQKEVWTKRAEFHFENALELSAIGINLLTLPLKIDTTNIIIPLKKGCLN